MAPKRKAGSEDERSESEEEASASESSASSTIKKKASKSPAKKKVATIKKPVIKSKKPKTDVAESSKSAGDDDGEVKVHTNGEGDKYLDLGKKKRAVVRSFKGMALLDIREYYTADGEDKPGKKGISLTLEQWEVLKEGSNAIDNLFAQQKKK